MNPDKMKMPLVGLTSFWKVECHWFLMGVVLHLKAQVRSSGMSLNVVPFLDAQVTVATGKAFYQFRLMCQLRPFLEKSDQCSGLPPGSISVMFSSIENFTNYSC